MKSGAELEPALTSEDPEERRRAVEGLAGPASGVRPENVLAALGDTDWRVRKQAIELAVALAPAPEVLSSLITAFKPGENVGLRNAAVEAIGAYGTAAVEALSDCLPSLDADGKKLAAEALARTGQPSSLAVLRPLLNDSDPNVRAAAIEAIATVGSSSVSEAFDILESFARRDQEEAFVRLSALDGINRLGALLPWRSIERMLDEPVLERSALAAAGRSGHPEAFPALLAALGRARGGGVAAVLAALVDYARAFAQNQLILRAEPIPDTVVERLLELASPRNEDLRTRKGALVVAGALGIERIAAIAAEALSDARLLAEADESLGLLGARAVPALLARAAHADPETCAACIEVVAGLSDFQTAQLAVKEIRHWLQSAPAVVARAGLGALTILGDETCLATVSAWLDNDEVASAAETALAKLAQRYPDSARELARAAQSDGPEAHAAAVIHSSLPAPIRDSVVDDVAYLSLLLTNPSKAVRRAALAGLANAESALGVDAAAFALTDEEPEVRHAAVLALGRFRGPDGSLIGIGKLLELVEKSDDQELLSAALGALGEAGDPRVLPVLRPLVRSAPPLVAVSAIESIARVPDSRRIDALIEGLSHTEPEVVKASMIALGDTIDPRVMAHFGACLDHQAWDVRRLAADMLARGGGESATALLRARLGAEDNPLVQETISRALDSVSGTRHTPLPPRAGSLRPR